MGQSRMDNPETPATGQRQPKYTIKHNTKKSKKMSNMDLQKNWIGQSRIDNPETKATKIHN